MCSDLLKERYDLVACDIDGTLLGKDEQLTGVHQELKEFIKQKNIPFTFISGRSWPGLKKIVDFFKPSLPVVGNNGGTVYQNGKVLWSHVFDAKPLWNALNEAYKRDMAIIFTIGVHEYVYKHNDYLQNQIEKFGRYDNVWTAKEDEWAKLTLDKLLIIDPAKPGHIDCVLNAIPDEFKTHLNIIRYNDRSADLTAKLADKAVGLKDLKTYLHAKKAIACGDDLNDMAFLQAADLGIAVANANPDLCKVADYVTKQESAAGILAFLKMIYGA